MYCIWCYCISIYFTLQYITFECISIIHSTFYCTSDIIFSQWVHLKLFIWFDSILQKQLYCNCTPLDSVLYIHCVLHMYFDFLVNIPFHYTLHVWYYILIFGISHNKLHIIILTLIRYNAALVIDCTVYYDALLGLVSSPVYLGEIRYI